MGNATVHLESTTPKVQEFNYQAATVKTTADGSFVLPFECYPGVSFVATFVITP